MKSNKPLQALVRLVEDPDENVFEYVRDEIMNKGPEIIPFLEYSWEEEDYGLLFQSRVENLIKDIQFKSVKDDLSNWINSSDKDLLQGAIIISRYQYPNLDEQIIHDKIQQIRKDIWLELNQNQTAYEKVRLFNKIFFGKHGFTGNSKDFHSPNNSFINTVLETHKGTPLSLSLTYSIIAQSLDMPIYGVNLPNHFVLAYLDENQIGQFLPTENEHGVLFYINAFSKGGIFDQNEIKEFLNDLGKENNRSYFEPCSNSSILTRMLTNLIAAFQQVGNKEKVTELIEMRDLFNLNL